MLSKAERVANQARNSLSKYCAEECKAYCCRKAYIVLRENQVDKVTQNRREELLKKGVLKKLDDGRYSLHLGDRNISCPSLDKNFMCTIHKSKLRAQACRDFPLFMEGNMVKLSPRCLAVKNDKLYPYVRQLLGLGCKLVRGDPFADIELYEAQEILKYPTKGKAKK